MDDLHRGVALAAQQAQQYYAWAAAQQQGAPATLSPEQSAHFRATEQYWQSWQVAVAATEDRVQRLLLAVAAQPVGNMNPGTYTDIIGPGALARIAAVCPDAIQDGRLVIDDAEVVEWFLARAEPLQARDVRVQYKPLHEKKKRLGGYRRVVEAPVGAWRLQKASTSWFKGLQVARDIFVLDDRRVLANEITGLGDGLSEAVALTAKSLCQLADILGLEQPVT